jgi:hypothetical protein
LRHSQLLGSLVSRSTRDTGNELSCVSTLLSLSDVHGTLTFLARHLQASSPESTTRAYMLGGFSWFSIPWGAIFTLQVMCEA